MSVRRMAMASLRGSLRCHGLRTLMLVCALLVGLLGMHALAAPATATGQLLAATTGAAAHVCDDDHSDGHCPPKHEHSGSVCVSAALGSTVATCLSASAPDSADSAHTQSVTAAAPGRPEGSGCGPPIFSVLSKLRR
jgi:hypothetical protein